MNKRILPLLIFTAVGTNTMASISFPEDVQAFVKNADLCDHLAGEFDSDLSRERKTAIEHGVARYCGLAKKNLPLLMEKYKNNKNIRTVLSKHTYDAVKDFPIHFVR